MSQRDEPKLPRSSEDELRDVVLKSGFSGVAATVLVVAICSPAGLGGMIGTSVASSLGFNPKTPDANTLNFGAAPAPLTSAELATIHETLQSTDAQIANIRAATDSEIQYMHDVASSQHIALAAPVTIAPMAHTTLVANHVAHPSSVAAASASGFVDPHLELAALLLPDDSEQLSPFQN